MAILVRYLVKLKKASIEKACLKGDQGRRHHVLEEQPMDPKVGPLGCGSRPQGSHGLKHTLYLTLIVMVVT